MRRLLSLITLLAVGGLATPAGATPPITVDELLRSDVIVAPGASLSDGDRARLQAAAKELAKPNGAGIAFPTKFVLIPAPGAGANLRADAEELRAGAIKRLKDPAKLDAVLLLAPRALGISANAFNQDIDSAFTAERSTFQKDPVAGVIAIAKRFQALEATGEQTPGATPKAVDDGVSPLVWGGGAVVLLIGAVGFAMARRTAKRADAAFDETARQRAADDGAPPPELRQ